MNLNVLEVLLNLYTKIHCPCKKTRREDSISVPVELKHGKEITQTASTAKTRVRKKSKQTQDLFTQIIR